jgi:hypothetical protein
MSEIERDEMRKLRDVAKAAQNLVTVMGVPEGNVALQQTYNDLVFALEAWEAN